MIRPHMMLGSLGRVLDRRNIVKIICGMVAANKEKEGTANLIYAGLDLHEKSTKYVLNND